MILRASLAWGRGPWPTPAVANGKHVPALMPGDLLCPMSCALGCSTQGEPLTGRAEAISDQFRVPRPRFGA